MKRFDIIKPVENHPDYICCTECWQRGIEWGGAGEQERIIALLEMQLETIRDSQLTGVVVLSSAIALIKGEN